MCYSENVVIYHVKFAHALLSIIMFSTNKKAVCTMKAFFDSILNRTVYQIGMGETFSTTDPDLVLNTLVGSCVAVCLADRRNGVYGINHFLLPGRAFKHAYDSKYGINAITSLIDQMVAKGADTANLEAKVFGAGKLIENDVFEVSRNNATFVKRFLSGLNIPITYSDLGGKSGRNIHCFCDKWEVVVQPVINNLDFNLSTIAQ